MTTNETGTPLMVESCKRPYNNSSYYTVVVVVVVGWINRPLSIQACESACECMAIANSMKNIARFEGSDI